MSKKKKSKKVIKTTSKTELEDSLKINTPEYLSANTSLTNYADALKFKNPDYPSVNTTLTNFADALKFNTPNYLSVSTTLTNFADALKINTPDYLSVNTTLTSFADALKINTPDYFSANTSLTSFADTFKINTTDYLSANTSLTSFADTFKINTTDYLSTNTSLTSCADTFKINTTDYLSTNASLTSFADTFKINTPDYLSASASLNHFTDALKINSTNYLTVSSSLNHFADALKINTLASFDSESITKISNAFTYSKPYEEAKAYIDKSIMLDETIKPPFIFNNSVSAINNLIQPQAVTSNLILHNASELISNTSSSITHNLDMFSDNLKKYTNTIFLLDKNLLCANNDTIIDYIDSTMKYIDSNNIGDFTNNKENIISISEYGTELLDEVNQENIGIEDYQLVNDLIDISNINIRELSDFYRFIKKYPMLAMADPHGIGQKIYNSISTNYNINLIVESDLIFFKCRKYTNPDEEMPYSEDDLYLAPYGIPTRGRFNSPELNHLYLSTNLSATLYELSVKPNDKIAILKCSSKRELKLFDLTKGNYSLKNFCLKQVQDNSKTEYIIPNFVSCCCRMAGYDGIKYNSVKNESFINYVLFEHNTENFNTIEITDYYIINISKSDFKLIDEDGNNYTHQI